MIPDYQPTFVDIFEVPIFKLARFGRTPTLKEDLEDLRKKWRNTKTEVTIGAMIDFVKLFQHNAEEYKNWWGTKNDNQSCLPPNEGIQTIILKKPDNDS